MRMTQKQRNYIERLSDLLGIDPDMSIEEAMSDNRGISAYISDLEEVYHEEYIDYGDVQ